MHTVILILHVFVSVFMILVILLQPSKDGGGMGGLGGGTSASAFGGRGSATFLSKITTACAAIFMITSMTLSYMSSKTESAILNYKPASKPAAPAPPKDEKTIPSTPPAGAAPTAPAAPAPAAPAPAPAPAGH